MEHNEEHKTNLPPHLQRSLDAFEKALKSMSKEDIEKYFPYEEPLPVGWINVEEHLPIVTIDDLIKNGEMCKHIKVKNVDGYEFPSTVYDHDIWKYRAKDAKVTHWYNEG